MRTMLYIWGAIFIIIGVITLGSVIRGLIDGICGYRPREGRVLKDAEVEYSDLDTQVIVPVRGVY